MKLSIYLPLLMILLPRFSLGLNETLFASKFSQLSQCDRECMIPGISDAGCNLSNDTALQSCLCGNITAESIITNCIIDSCGFMGSIESQSVQQLLCGTEPHPTRQPEVLITAIFISLLVILCVALRCWSRYHISKEFWWDDWVTVFSAVLFLALQGLNIWGIKLGFGIHIWNSNIVTLHLSIESSIFLFLNSLFYCLIQYFTKVSTMLLYYRIFPFHWLHKTIFVFIVLMTVHATINLLLTIFRCHPISGLWNLAIPNATCINLQHLALSSAIVFILEDFFILGLPVPSILAMKLDLKRKIAVLFVLCIGLIAVVASLVRLRFAIHFAKANDGLWDSFGICITSMIELSLAIACVCFPAIHQLLKHYFPSMVSSNNSNNNIMVSLKFNDPNTNSDGFRPANPEFSNPESESKLKRLIGSRVIKWFDKLWSFKENGRTTSIRDKRNKEGEKVGLEELKRPNRLHTPNTIHRNDTVERQETDTTIFSAI